jgi:hypothetical protein
MPRIYFLPNIVCVHGLWNKRGMIFFNIAYTWTTFSKLYLGYDVFILSWFMCRRLWSKRGGGCRLNIWSCFLDHLPNIVNNTLANGSSYYGIDLTNLEVTPMGAFTLKCIELQKDNRKVSLVMKFYTCSMDTMVTTICTMCNINKSEIVL